MRRLPVDKVDVAGKRVLVRVDFNVPLKGVRDFSGLRGAGARPRGCGWLACVGAVGTLCVAFVGVDGGGESVCGK
jgi:hypothetical protein